MPFTECLPDPEIFSKTLQTMQINVLESIFKIWIIFCSSKVAVGYFDDQNFGASSRLASTVGAKVVAS